MKHLIVGTAGHIDHGKSALVKALTDIDPDRLKEEKERGLTIDLGFAFFDLPDGTRVAFVDVPGHERFVKNMLAGAAGMDIVILVVDATESVMPQTREHLDIMKLLGVSRGMIAITKTDLADEEMMEIVEEEIKDLVADSFLDGAPVLRVSSKTGEGLDKIRQLIAQAVKEQPQKSEDGLFRFPIDRVFTMKGFGTVVTGTVFSGWLSEDEPVVVLPGGMNARARQLQNHNVKMERISAGMRASLNLANLSVQQLNRGDTLVRPGTAKPTHMLDASVQLLQSAPRDLKKTTTIKLYAATSQQMGRMTLIDRPKLEPGSRCYAQIRLSQPLCIFRGDHIVLRGESPEFTIGGGEVLDVDPVKFKGKDVSRSRWLQTLETASAEDVALAFISKKQVGVKLQDIAIRTCVPLKALQPLIQENIKAGHIYSVDAGDGSLLISCGAFDTLDENILGELSSFFESQPHRIFMPREELRSRLGQELAPQLFETALANLTSGGKLVDTREGLSLSGRAAKVTPAQQAAKEKMEKIFRDAGYSPPTFSQAEEQFDSPRTAKQMTAMLIEEGVLTKISPTLAYHRDHTEPMFDRIRAHFNDSERLGVGDLKTLLGISRKHAVPLLEYFDKIGFTTRVGDYRVLKKISHGNSGAAKQ